MYGADELSTAGFTSTFLRLIDLDEVRIWRASRRVRFTSIAMATVMLALTAYVTIWASRGFDTVSAILVLAFVLIDVVVLRLARYAFRAVTAAEPAGLRIGRGRRAVVVPWPVIEACTAGDRGITIDCSDGRRALAAAPQRSNASRGAHSKTDADYAALYIAERARLYRLATAAPPLADRSGLELEQGRRALAA